MNARNRGGLTIMDVVVVVIVMLIVAALFLPQISRSRHLAAQSDCKNKLKNIGFALHNYEETHKTFPPGWVSVSGPDAGEQEQSAYGWSTYILPYLVGGPLYKTIDFNAVNPSFQAQASRSPDSFAAIELRPFRCPSDLGDAVDRTSSVPLMATSSYVGNFGVGLPLLHHDSDSVRGIFGCNSRIRIRDIRDGTTNVVLAGERMLPREGRTWPMSQLDGPFNSYWAGIPRGTNPLAIVATVTDGDITESGVEDMAALNIKGKLNGFHNTPRQVRAILVNKSITGKVSSPKDDPGREVSAGFSSDHLGGTQVLLGDASVRFVSNSVDPNTWINLMRRSDGEKLDEF